LNREDAKDAKREAWWLDVAFLASSRFKLPLRLCVNRAGGWL